MIHLTFDLETTGFDAETDIITEIAWSIKDSEDPKPLAMETHFVFPGADELEALVIPDEIYKLTKITKKHLGNGLPLEHIYHRMHSQIRQFDVNAIIAHNGVSFDRPFLLTALKKRGFKETPGYDHLFELPMIDTMTDLPYPEDCKQRNLMYLAAYHGFLNPFPHAALPDVLTTMRIAGLYDLNAALELSKSPWIMLEADVGFHNKDLAKERGYRWQQWDQNGKIYPKSWVKKVRECHLLSETEGAPFKIYPLV